MNKMYIEGAESKSFINYVPQKKSKSEYAIYFVITDNYSFAAASMIMSLYKHSSVLMKNTDIIIYHDGLTEENKQLLQKLHHNILYVPVVFPEIWRPLVEHPRNSRWGYIIIAKLYGLFLIHQYKKVLLMDVDMHITDDISELFDIEEAIAWRPVVAWKPKVVFENILIPNYNEILAGNGGLWLFSEKLTNYNIDVESIKDAFETIKDLRPGGMDELTLAWIAYINKIAVKELDVCYFNTSVQANKKESKLIHFLDYKTINTKPWKNPVSFIYFSDWVDNYNKWIAMGGDAVINFSRDDYFAMFGFDKAKEIDNLKKKLKAVDNYISLKEENEKLKKELSKIKNSRSYKLTAPLRWIGKKIRKIKKFFKK